MTEAMQAVQAGDERRRITGTVGLVIAIAVALILGVHPLGSTDLYDDGVRFTNHVSPFWVAIHVVGALLLLGVPTVVAAWGETVATPAGQVFARMAATISIAGVGLSLLHLTGTDTLTFLAYKDTLDSGVEGAVVGADVLLRLHAATLMAFVLSLFVGVPVAAALAMAMDRDYGWRFWMPVVTATLALTSATVTLLEGQWTTLSEMGLFRPAIVLFLIWFGLISYRLRRTM